MSGDVHTSLVIVERSSGLVLEYGGDLPHARDSLIGRDWRDALGVPAECTAVVSQAISAGVATALPPTVLFQAGEENIVAGGMVVPETWQGKAVVLLFLRRLWVEDQLLEPEGIDTADIVAVLGLDRLEFSPSWGAVETEGLMMDLRSGLQQLLRDGDWIGLPTGATITLVLRDLEPETALDISRALLSHLHQRLANQEGGAQYARACIGLSQRLEGQDPLSALLAANGALLQAQAGSEERIRFSSPWDPLAMAARAINSGGVFRDAVEDPAARRYLQALTNSAVEHLSADAAVAAVLNLTTNQAGLCATALVRKDYQGQATVVATCENRQGQVTMLPQGKIPAGLQGVLRRFDVAELESGEFVAGEDQVVRLYPLRLGGELWGCLALLDDSTADAGFAPSAAALQYIGTTLGGRGLAVLPGAARDNSERPLAREMEKGIEGYVLDNMEGAIDQAAFLSRVDIPVAIIGPRGTGKMYIAQMINTESGGSPGALVKIDCRSFRSRNDAVTKLQGYLEQSADKTLVFKSPQLMHLDAQARLARMLASRTISDEQGSRYLPAARYIALFPYDIMTLVKRGELEERLASVFAGYPIRVPPLKERGRAVLRWAHKILEQEASQTDQRVLGFTADAEQAMLQHPWPGNISEMREVISAALERTEKEWITPVDLGIFIGISADGLASHQPQKPFLEVMQAQPSEQQEYTPSALEELQSSLAQALAAVLETGVVRPLGAWLDDEIVLAAGDRYSGDARAVSEFLQTRSRNIGRWMPKIQEREPERSGSLLWQETRELVQKWIMSTPPLDVPPQQFAQEILMALVLQQCSEVSLTDRARIMGVSTPTYQKRLKQIAQEA
jgi:DNA-binding NtrC family response regulator